MIKKIYLIIIFSLTLVTLISIYYCVHKYLIEAQSTTYVWDWAQYLIYIPVVVASILPTLFFLYRVWRGELKQSIKTNLVLYLTAIAVIIFFLGSANLYYGCLKSAFLCEAFGMLPIIVLSWPIIICTDICSMVFWIQEKNVKSPLT